MSSETAWKARYARLWNAEKADAPYRTRSDGDNPMVIACTLPSGPSENFTSSPMAEPPVGPSSLKAPRPAGNAFAARQRTIPHTGVLIEE